MSRQHNSFRNEVESSSTSAIHAMPKRGRRRPPKPRLRPEEVTAEMVRDALAAADEVERAKRRAARQLASGLDGEALRLVHKLSKRGPEAVRQFHRAYLRYIEAAGLLDANAPSSGPGGSFS